MVHLVGIGGREFSVSSLAGCRSPFTETTPTGLGLSQPGLMYRFVWYGETLRSSFQAEACYDRATTVYRFRLSAQVVSE